MDMLEHWQLIAPLTRARMGEGVVGSKGGAEVRALVCHMWVGQLSKPSSSNEIII